METTANASIPNPSRPTPIPARLTGRPRRVLELALASAERDLNLARAAHAEQAATIQAMLEVRSRRVFANPGLSSAEKATEQALLQAHYFELARRADAALAQAEAYHARQSAELEAALAATPTLPSLAERDMLAVAAAAGVTR